MRLQTLLAGGALPALSAAAVAAAPGSTKRQNSGSNACAQISEAWEEANDSGSSSFFNSNTTELEVKPSTAYECLRSISVDTDRDRALLEWLKPWLEFQSTIGILADPPSGYMYPGVDIFKGLEEMDEKLSDDEYDNQYEFVQDLYRLINVKPREGHLNFMPALTNIIRFHSPALFISISEDGTSLPSVYLYDDYERSQDADYTPSAVETFEGSPIAEWLAQRAVDNDRNQDPDASYNAQLYSAALQNIGITQGAGRYAHGNLSDTSTLVFANGSELTIENTAFVYGDWSDIESGDDVHERFEVPDRSGEADSDPVRDGEGPERPAPDMEGYPEPIIKHEDNYLSGYLFNESILADTAVLSVQSFLSPDGEAMIEDDIMEFERVVTSFVRSSSSAGHERLILDFQGNGGGSLASLLILFVLLFPGEDFYLPLRARANDVLEWMGETAEDTGIDMFPTFDIDYYIDEDDSRFRTWDAFYDTEELSGDEFTQVYQPMELRTINNLPQLPGSSSWFSPNNTVIVTDGFCASACAIAVGLMNRHLGVRTIAMGGRPMNAPMQAIGGTKGGPVLNLNLPQLTYEDMAQMSRPPSDLDDTPFSSPYPPLSGAPGSTAVVNSANVYHPDHTDGTPLQFVYEAANCRLFYTWDTLTNLTALWEAVANVEWNDEPCVSGSTVNDDGSISDDMPEFSQDYVSNYTWAEGPGDISDAAPDGTPDDQFGSDGTGSGGTGNSGDGDDDNAAAGVGGNAATAVFVSVVAAVALFI